MIIFRIIFEIVFFPLKLLGMLGFARDFWKRL